MKSGLSSTASSAVWTLDIGREQGADEEQNNLDAYLECGPEVDRILQPIREALVPEAALSPTLSSQQCAATPTSFSLPLGLPAGTSFCFIYSTTLLLLLS